MSYIIGIDTGGTYTDSVLVSFGDRKVLKKSKAFTTKEDLCIGIRKSLEGLHLELDEDIVFVAMSTTLATNAIVEGRGCNVGTILIGDKIKNVPSHKVGCVSGKMDIRGRVVEKVNVKEVENLVREMQTTAEAFAISGYASVRNPEQEIEVEQIVKRMTNLPTVCAHELTSSLGFEERSVTAALNATLLPIIDELIRSVNCILRELKINAPVMVVKGDGSLMQEKMALEKPIETILSGPAASIMGAKFLAKREDAIVFDMGGTTSDTAHLCKGNVRINNAGAKVSGWQTSVKAAEISTFGTGGDSWIRIGDDRNFKIGPKKVMPLCVAAMDYPNLIAELKMFRKPEEYKLCEGQEIDCFVLLQEKDYISYSDDEKELLAFIDGQAHSLFCIADHFCKDPEQLGLKRMVESGTIARISLTPTCILHQLDLYAEWNKEIVDVAIGILSESVGWTKEKFAKRAKDGITRQLCICCLQSMTDFEGAKVDLINSKESSYFVDRFFYEGNNKLLTSYFQINKPIIGIGAPAEIWVKLICEKLNTESIIPDHCEVANAIGAAVGDVRVNVSALIRREQFSDGFVVYGPRSRQVYGDLQTAKREGRKLVSAHAEEKGRAAGAEGFEVMLTDDDKFCYDGNQKTYIESIILATVVGKPNCIHG